MLSKEQILNKVTRWCAYQDRSEYETIQKLLSMQVKREDVQGIIQYLKDENYLNEERFVRYYVWGKMNNKKWGIEKIKFQLKQKYKVPEVLIKSALQEIDKEVYMNKLKELILKKIQVLEKKEKDKSVLKKKIINFALSKGFEMLDIYEIFQQINFK